MDHQPHIFYIRLTAFKIKQFVLPSSNQAIDIFSHINEWKYFGSDVVSRHISNSRNTRHCRQPTTRTNIPSIDNRRITIWGEAPGFWLISFGRIKPCLPLYAPLWAHSIDMVGQPACSRSSRKSIIYHRHNCGESRFLSHSSSTIQ